MAYKITNLCTSCGLCIPECPVNCIGKGDSIFIIDEHICIECGACSNICPAGAPILD